MEAKTNQSAQVYMALGGLVLIYALMAVLPKSVLPQGSSAPLPWWQHVINFGASGALIGIGIKLG